MGSRLEANSTAVRKRIEKHKFDDEKGEEYEASKFGGFPEYFRRKKIKLQNLDAERRSSSIGNPPIFRGVVAHVNGYTQPSLQDLHSLIVSYGGGFLQYLDGKTAVTHIIASNLTPKKKVEFRRYRIVKPAWVVDSVKAGTLLPWDAYRLVDEGISQQVLGFDNGNIISQINSQTGGYKDQTDASWYTGQVKSVADELNLVGHSNDDSAMSLPNALAPSFVDVYDLGNLSPNLSEEIEPPNLEAQPSIADQSPVLYARDPGDVDDESRTSTVVAIGSDWHGDTIAKVTDDATQIQSPTRALNHIDILSGHADTDSAPSRKESKKTAEEHNAELLENPRVWKSTVVNPDFLKQYYEESRLHHLSTWKAELKSQLQAAAAEKSFSQKLHQRRAPGSRRYILHVDFDSFFAAVSLKKFPQYVDKPAVVAHGGGSGSEIASCNYPARKFGVKNGMWMKAAQQICPDLKVLPYDFKAYEDASRSFYDAIISTGGVVQSVSVDEALVDVSNICIAAGGHDGKAVQESSIWREQAKADDLAKSLRDQIKELTGCAVSVGIGGNILLAKVALRKAKPAGQYQIKPEDVLDFIGGLTVQDLPGVAYSIGGKLDEIGAKYVKDVRELSKEKLMTTLGPKTGEKIWDYARGIDRTEVGEQVIRKSVSAEVNWGIRFVTQEQADEFVQSLCEELSKRLVNERAKGRQLTMKIMRRAADAPLDPPKHLGHGKCDTFNKSLLLGVATNSKEILGREAISIMRGFGFSPGELRGIGVQVTKLEPLKGSAENPLESSQKRLQFKTAGLGTSPKQDDNTNTDDIESPQQQGGQAIPSITAVTASKSPDQEPRKAINMLGTQFILPSQVDPDVLAELPEDIRSKLESKQHTKDVNTSREAIPSVRSHSNSPAVSPDGLPNLSQLDQDTLDALPSDVRAEVLAFYHKSPHKSPGQSLLPQSPRKIRSIKPPTKKTSSGRKRTGLLFRKKQSSKLDTNSTLTQSNFIATRVQPIKAKANPDTALSSEADEEVSSEFLSALPEDIRQEVLAQQRHDRLKKRGGIDVAVVKKKVQRSVADQPPPGQRNLLLPPRQPKPTFTANRLSALPQLREAVSAWYGEFVEEGPYQEDVEALVTYLDKVVGEEKDMAKAVNVVRWLGWVIDQGDGYGKGGEQWRRALTRVEDGVQGAVSNRGLGSVAF
ncbi:MAG: DNA repair REV1 [Lasallia pustulata]|uniref:DNA repair protein REV1 n=1 Tax=Lasallia pustulata TaxID=136370 RepID=A0A5M8PVF7_9LECA|nr:MAG: DNA repair REV1 [Lasallia pustulata]